MTNKNKLQYFNQIYECILHNEGSQDEKDRLLARLMTEMEKEFNIPIIKDDAWENENEDVVTLYRKVSLSRSLN